jgi:hypothetical protein
MLAALVFPSSWMVSIAQGFLPYVIENGDTVFVDSVEPAVKVGTMTKKEERQYKKLVKDFATVYPYSLLARELVDRADRTFEEQNMTRRQKEKYIGELQRRIIESYEETARHMSMSQGRLMMRLISRETSKSPNQLIRDYKSGLAAGFWQGMAGLFGVDMKEKYDPDGKDRYIERLVCSWADGSFPAIYRSYFGKDPVIPKVPENIEKFL